MRRRQWCSLTTAFRPTSMTAAAGAPLGDFHQGVILGIEPPCKFTPSKTLTI
jgi:hypothetical protein